MNETERTRVSSDKPVPVAYATHWELCMNISTGLTAESGHHQDWKIFSERASWSSPPWTHVWQTADVQTTHQPQAEGKARHSWQSSEKWWAPHEEQARGCWRQCTEAQSDLILNMALLHGLPLPQPIYNSSLGTSAHHMCNEVKASHRKGKAHRNPAPHVWEARRDAKNLMLIQKFTAPPEYPLKQRMDGLPINHLQGSWCVLESTGLPQHQRALLKETTPLFSLHIPEPWTLEHQNKQVCNPILNVTHVDRQDNAVCPVLTLATIKDRYLWETWIQAHMNGSAANAVASGGTATLPAKFRWGTDCSC